jgi:hypothetical protein
LKNHHLICPSLLKKNITFVEFFLQAFAGTLLRATSGTVLRATSGILSALLAPL